MKKRLLSLGLAALMAVSLTACGGSDAGASSAEGAAEKVASKAKEVAEDAKEAVEGAVSGVKNIFKKDGE